MSIESLDPDRDRGAGSIVGTSAWIDGPRPPEDLLPDGGVAPSPAPAPATTAVRGALDQVVKPWIKQRILTPQAGEPPDRQVEVVLHHLAPISSRSALVSSYEREAFHWDRAASAGRRAHAVRTAYACRWQALGPDRDMGADRPEG